MSRRVLIGLLCVFGGACAPKGEPFLVLTPDKVVFDGRTERVSFRVHAYLEDDSPGGGLLQLDSPVGTFVGGTNLILDQGVATSTFVCNPDEQLACLGSIRVTAQWNGVDAVAQLRNVLAAPPATVNWSVVPTGLPFAMHASVVDRGGLVWAVGERGAVARLEGDQWTAVHSMVGTALRAATIGPTGKPVIVGDDGVVMVWSGSQFAPWPVQLPQENFTAVAFNSHDQLLLGTESGLIYEQQGAELVPTISLHTPVLSLVQGAMGLWATGEGVLLQSVSDQWFSLPSPTNGTLRRAYPGGAKLWLTGDREGARSPQGLLVAGPAPSWRTTALSVPVTGMVEVAGGAERFAFGENHLFRQIEDGSWSSVPCPSVIEAGASRGTGDLVLVGPPGISLVRVP